MRLVSPQVADRIDAECRIEHGEGAADTGKEEATDSSHDPIVEKADHERGSEPAKHKGCIVPVLPNGDRINRHTRRIFGIGVRVWSQKPPAVAMPEPQSGIIGVFFTVAVSMVAEVISGPLDGGILQGPGTSNQERGFHPVRAIEAAMGHETMIADCDSEAADEIKQSKQRPVEPCVVVEIAIERHTYDCTEDYGSKQENRPASVVASYDRTDNVCVRECRDIRKGHRIVSYKGLICSLVYYYT